MALAARSLPFALDCRACTAKPPAVPTSPPQAQALGGTGMADGVALALGAMVLYGLADWVYKRAAAKGIEAHHFLVLQSCFFTPGVFLYGLVTGTLVPGVAFLWGMLAGVLVFVALYNFARSLKTGAVSIVVPVYRLSFAITVVLAVWLLDEPLTGWKLAGLAASLVAVWLLLGGTARAAHASWPAVAQVLVATLAMGVVSLVYKFGTNAGGSPATILAGQATVFLPLTIVFALIRDRGGFRPPPGAWRHSATAALLFLSGLIMLIAGLQRGQASVLVPVAQLSFVVTVGLGFVFLGETLTRRKGLGLAFAIAALVCLTRS